jgi:hypothetical protein
LSNDRVMKPHDTRLTGRWKALRAACGDIGDEIAVRAQRVGRCAPLSTALSTIRPHFPASGTNPLSGPADELPTCRLRSLDDFGKYAGTCSRMPRAICTQLLQGRTTAPTEGIPRTPIPHGVQRPPPGSNADSDWRHCCKPKPVSCRARADVMALMASRVAVVMRSAAGAWTELRSQLCQGIQTSSSLSQTDLTGSNCQRGQETACELQETCPTRPGRCALHT